MPVMSLEELLRSSLEGVNREFQEADQALHSEVVRTSDALSKITEGVVQVKLGLISEDENGIIYSFSIDAKKSNHALLGVFLVSVKGFPIMFGPDAKLVKRGEDSVTIRDLSQLRDFFHNMASNPDSPLIQKVAYVMRKKSG